MSCTLTLTEVAVVVLSLSHTLSLFVLKKDILTKTTIVADFCECGYESLGYVKAGPCLRRRISVR
jgi:hypothetical protein